MPPLPTRICTFLCVAFVYAATIFALATIDPADAGTRRAEPILLEFVPEKPPVVPDPEPEMPAVPDESAAEEISENPEIPESAAEIAEPEAAPLPPPEPEPEIPNFQTEDAHDAASGNAADAHGDDENADKTLGVPAAATAEILPKITESEPEISAGTDAVLPDSRERGGEKIGERGNAESADSGDFGSGGNGFGADATVRYRSRVTPKYPRADMLAGRTGTVVLLLEIDERGELVSVSVRRSSGSKSLDAAAVRAARASKYFPARDGSRAVASRAEVSYDFRR